MVMPGTVHLKASDPKVQADLNRYYEQCRADGKNSKEYCARVAWNILCANKSPDYPGCTEFGKTWGAPYSAPKGEGVEDCPCRRKFGALMAAIQEDKNAGLHGSVDRPEFDVHPSDGPLATVELTTEARLEAEKYVLNSTPTYLKFQNVQGQDVIAYGDRRGRSVIVPVSEMADSELVWLATERGWVPSPAEILPPVPVVAPESHEGSIESLRNIVSGIMEAKTEGFEGIGNQYKVQSKRGTTYSTGGRASMGSTDFFRIVNWDRRRVNVLYDNEASGRSRELRVSRGKTDVDAPVTGARERSIPIGFITYNPDEENEKHRYRAELDVEYREFDPEHQGGMALKTRFYRKTAKDALEEMCDIFLDWLKDPGKYEGTMVSGGGISEWGSVVPKSQKDIGEKGRVSMDPSVALKWLKLINQAQQKDDKKAMLGIARAAAKKYELDEPSLPFEVRKFAIMLSHLAGTKPPPWTSESYIPGVQEAEGAAR